MTNRILSKTESEAEEKAKTMECKGTTHVDGFGTRTKEGLALSSLRPLMVAAPHMHMAYAQGMCCTCTLQYISCSCVTPGRWRLAEIVRSRWENELIDRVLGDMEVEGKIACLRSTDTCHFIMSVPERRKETGRQ
jgi:hypothetical protein